MASLGSIPATYTRMGTVRIEPPPPSTPRETPMSSDSASTTTSMRSMLIKMPLPGP